MVPPMMDKPIGSRVSEPIDEPKMSGVAAATVAAEVMSTGRKRIGQASTNASLIEATPLVRT